jgi:hypothetical protein
MIPGAEAEQVSSTHTLFRHVNERLSSLNAGFAMFLPRGAFVCECADPGCTQLVELSLEAYEAIRATHGRFMVAVGREHVASPFDRLVERHDGYWVVQKQPTRQALPQPA